jgi:hypothetical protein
MRVEYDEIDRVFRIYRGSDWYCSMTVDYRGDFDSFEIVKDKELVVRTLGNVVARFDEYGRSLS